MGGFAAEHHRVVDTLEKQGDARLVATCDLNPGAYDGELSTWKNAGRPVAFFEDYRAMLDAHAGEIDVLAIPAPIPLHAQMHRDGVDRGMAVFLEKPPTLDPVELTAMLSVEERCARTTLVGYNFTLEKERLELKRRLCAGEFGKLQAGSFLGLAPRANSYFSRNDWAGKLFVNEQLALDSCFGNDMADFGHNLLLWAGTDGMEQRATVEQARAWLGRAHKIEGADTFFVEALTSDGIPLRFAQTHALSGESRQIEMLACEKATISYEVARNWEVKWNDGRCESGTLERPDTLMANYLAYFDYLSGHRSKPPTTLADSRSFVELNALTYLSSAAITSFASSRLKSRAADDGDQFVEVEGLADELRKFATGSPWSPPEPPWVSRSQAAELRASVEKLRG